jgi:hypothetical protein
VRRKAIALVAASGILVGLVTGLSVTAYGVMSEPTLPACAEEDSLGPCQWNGGSNGLGRSFVVDADQTVHYLN